MPQVVFDEGRKVVLRDAIANAIDDVHENDKEITVREVLAALDEVRDKLARAWDRASKIATH